MSKTELNESPYAEILATKNQTNSLIALLSNINENVTIKDADNLLLGPDMEVAADALGYNGIKITLEKWGIWERLVARGKDLENDPNFSLDDFEKECLEKEKTSETIHVSSITNLSECYFVAGFCPTCKNSMRRIGFNKYYKFAVCHNCKSYAHWSDALTADFIGTKEKFEYWAKMFLLLQKRYKEVKPFFPKNKRIYDLKKITLKDILIEANKTTEDLLEEIKNQISFEDRFFDDKFINELLNEEAQELPFEEFKDKLAIQYKSIGIIISLPTIDYKFIGNDCYLLSGMECKVYVANDIPELHKVCGVFDCMNKYNYIKEEKEC